MDLFNVSSRVANAGLVALVVLDVVLVGVALRPAQASIISKSPVSSASTSTSAKPSSTSSGSATKAQTAPAAPLRTMLVAIDNKRAWRVGAGSCAGGGATLTRTADGGRTWVEGGTPLRRIVRVKPGDGRAAFVIGADASCAAILKDTSDGGDTWGSGGSAGDAWFRDPKSARTVRAPGSSTSQPCGKRAVLDLAALSNDSARALCVDGLVRQTTDTGSSWTNAGKVKGAVALAVASASPGQTYVARLNAPSCPGVQILRVGQGSATSCLPSPLPGDPGQIALSLVKGGGWLALGDTTMRSTDDLVTWSVS
jgi:hypothetical protein